MISLNDYANLRSYAGSETAVMLETATITAYLPETMRIHQPDNGVTLIVDAQTAAGSASSMTAITASIGGTAGR